MTSSLDYKLVTTAEELDALCAELSAADMIAVDTETEGIDYSDIIVGIALSTKPGSGRYIPIRHEAVDGVRYDNQLTPAEVYDKLGPILETKPCTGHNVKFDLKMFWKDGIDVNYVHDTLILAHVLGVEVSGSRGLKQLVGGLLGHNMNDIDSLFPKVGNKKPKIQPKILSPKEIEFYGCEDGNWSLQLYNYLIRLFNQKPNYKLVYATEMRLLRVVAEMESFGVPVSMSFLIDNGRRADEYIAKLKADILDEIRETLGDPDYEVNFKSPAQLSTLLFEHLQLPVIKYSQKTGKPSTDASVLQDLAKQSPIVQRVLTLRGLEKLNNTYLTGLQSDVNSDGRIRGSFNQVGTASGRFSSSKPNLQNLPKDQAFILWPISGVEALNIEEHFLSLNILGRGEDGEWQALDKKTGMWKDGYLGEFDGKEYSVHNGLIHESWKCKTRDFISAPDDYYLMEVDYSQVELRIMAGESGEDTLLDAYNSGDDVHSRTAGVIFGIPFEHVSEKDRHVGKTINFSLLYGAGPHNIATQLNITLAEAEDIVNKYFTNLPKIKSWINRVKADTKMDGYAETVFGRRRSFHNVRGSDRKLAEKELRESVNHHIQGAAADIMKTALVRASSMLRKYFGDDVRIVSTVHDSLLVEARDTCDPAEVLSVLKVAMEDISLDPVQRKKLAAGEVDGVSVMPGWPKLEIDAKVGQSWGSASGFDIEKKILPSDEYSGELEKVRVRKLAIEREAPSTDEVKWVVEFKHPVTDEQANWLVGFFEQRQDSNGDSARLIFTSLDGTIIDKELSSRFKIDFTDEMYLTHNVGPCMVSQDIDSIDYGEVLRGVDFDLS